MLSRTPPRPIRLRFLTACAIGALAVTACIDSQPAGLDSGSVPLRSDQGLDFYYVDVVIQSSNSGLCLPEGHIVNLYNKITGRSYSAPIIGNTAHIPVPTSDAGPGFVAIYRPISATIEDQRQAPFGGFVPESTDETSTCLASIYAPGNSNSAIPLTPPNFLYALDNYAFDVFGDMRTSPAMFVNPASVVRTALDLELVDGDGTPDLESNGTLGYLLQPFGVGAEDLPCPPDDSNSELCQFDPAILTGLGTAGKFNSGQVNFAAVIGLVPGASYAVEIASADNSKRWLGACAKGDTAESCKLARTPALARTYHVEDLSTDALDGPEILFGHGGFIKDGARVTRQFLSSVTTIGEGLVAHKRTLDPDGAAKSNDVFLDCRLDTDCTQVSKGRVVRATGFCYEQSGETYCQSDVVVDVKNTTDLDFGFQTFTFGTTIRQASAANLADTTGLRRADRGDGGGTFKLTF